jgi:hypothetical protein
MLHKLEKFKQEEGKQKLKSNSIPQSFLNESFGAFVDFASSKGNQTTTLCFKSTGVQSPEKKSAARPGRNLFWGIFLFNGEQLNVRNLILLNSLFLYSVY